MKIRIQRQVELHIQRSRQVDTIFCQIFHINSLTDNLIIYILVNLFHQFLHVIYIQYAHNMYLLY